MGVLHTSAFFWNRIAKLINQWYQLCFTTFPQDENTWYMQHNGVKFLFTVLLCFYEILTKVVFWPCQWNLIKTFKTEANTPLITKMALKFFWTFLLDSPNCKILSKTIWIFLKDSDNFWHRKMTLKARILQFGGSNNFDQKFSNPFLWLVEY